MNSALAISALCTPAKLDVGTATLLSASGACPARTGTECRTSLCRRTDDENIKHCIHCYFRNAVLVFHLHHQRYAVFTFSSHPGFHPGIYLQRLSFAACTISSHSFRVTAISFSHRTCLPSQPRPVRGHVRSWPHIRLPLLLCKTLNNAAVFFLKQNRICLHTFTPLSCITSRSSFTK